MKLKMMKKMIWVLLFVFFNLTFGIAQNKKSFTIAFGSCNKENLPQPLWDDILNEKPDLWIWLGDNIYGDSDDTTVLRAKYQKASDNPGYKKLTDQVPVIGTWDDHDYGKNDGNKTFSIRKESQQLALDFLGEPKESSRRKQEGIYTSYDYKAGHKKIKVILLDVRYHQDVLRREKGGYIPDSSADILGDAQWKWLEHTLKSSKADINIIGSGLQFIPDEHRTEKWGNFPGSLKRFYDLLVDSQAKGILLITGDRHIGEMTKIDLPGMKYPLYEFTSSGLTHSSVNDTTNVNRNRVGALVTQKHYGVFRFTGLRKQILLEASLKGDDGKTFTSKEIILK